MAKIMVMERDEQVAQAVILRLTEAGFDVERCVCGTDHRAIYDGATPDVIIVDTDEPLGIPSKCLGCSHFCLPAQASRVVQLTELNTCDSRSEAVDRGASAVITKPYEAADLVATIRSLLADLDVPIGSVIERNDTDVEDTQ